MKRILYVTLSLLFVFMSLAPISALAESEKEDHIRLYLNGREIKAEANSYRVKGHTVVPVRVVAEEFGAEVGWEPEERIVTVHNSKVSMSLQIDETKVTIGSDTEEQLPVAAFIDSDFDLTMVPLRFVAEKLGLKVIWDDVTLSVYLFPEGDLVQTESVKPSEDEGSSEEKEDPAGEESSNSDSDASSESSKPSTAQLGVIQMNEDGLSIATSGPASARAFTLPDPDRIIIDVEGVDLPEWLNGEEAKQNGVIEVTHPIVKQIRYARFSNDPMVVRIVVELHGAAPFVFKQDTDQQWTLQFIKGDYIVVIDAGHGGTDPGGSSINGKHEKDFTLAVSNKVYELLKKVDSIKVVASRTTDDYVTLDDRVALANNSGADLFVSIHANTFTRPEVRGTETYYLRENSKKLATFMHEKITAAAMLPDRKVREGNYKVIRETTMPAVLLEIGYLTNAAEEPILFDEAFQNKVAKAIAESIEQYLYQQ